MSVLARYTWFALALAFLLVASSSCNYTYESSTFYIRHYFAKCLHYDTTRQIFVFTSICKEKFRWSSGARLFHVPTNRCVNVNSTVDGSYLVLSSQCHSTSNLFQYDQANRAIIHLLSAKCWHPESGSDNPSSNVGVVIKSGCHLYTNKYYFRPNAYYIIRHFSGYCWMYIDFIKLRNPLVCDRFQYESDNRLRHVNSGKCVGYGDNAPYLLKLTQDCSSPNTVFKLNESNILVAPFGCVHPSSGSLNPPNNDLLDCSPLCADENRMRFYLLDERGKLY